MSLFNKLLSTLRAKDLNQTVHRDAKASSVFSTSFLEIQTKSLQLIFVPFATSILFCSEKPGPSPQCGIFDGPCLSRIAGVRVLRLCLGVLCLKSQIPSTKLQINHKFQYSMTKTFHNETLFGFSNFGHCYFEFQ